MSYHHGWFEEIPEEGLAVFYTAGWVVRENDDHIVVVSTLDAEGKDYFGHDTVIPTDCVLYREKIKGTDKWLLALQS